MKQWLNPSRIVDSQGRVTCRRPDLCITGYSVQVRAALEVRVDSINGLASWTSVKMRPHALEWQIGVLIMSLMLAKAPSMIPKMFLALYL